MSASPSRRRLLQVAALSPVVVSCTPRRPVRPAPVDPDVTLRAAAVAREHALVERYRAAASSPLLASRTAGLIEQHEQHLAALGAPSPAPSLASPSPAAEPSPLPLPTLAQLAAAEHATSAAHAHDALEASRPLAALLASLAASEASHSVVLA